MASKDHSVFPRGVQELAGTSRYCRSAYNAAILQSSPAAWSSAGRMAGGCVHQCRDSPCASAASTRRQSFDCNQRVGCMHSGNFDTQVSWLPMKRSS
jgi:hypothetical protein